MIPLESLGQNRFSLKVQGADSISKKLVRKINYDAAVQSKEAVQQVLGAFLSGFYERGYLAARFDTVIYDTASATGIFTAGMQYTWLNLSHGNADAELLHEEGFKQHQLKGKKISIPELMRLSDKMIRYCENNGYPFVSFQLDSVRIDSNRISAAIMLKKNDLVKIDSISVKGNARIARSYFYYYLKVRPGNLYNESIISKIPQRTRDLQFLTEKKPMEIVFEPGKAKIVMYLDRKKASRFDGLLGVMPNNRTTGKLMLNGELKLALLSAFGRGELIDLQWRKLEKATQDLKIHLIYPYIFATPLGIDVAFKLYKKDTSYLSVNTNIGIQYLFSSDAYIKGFAEIASSSLLKATGLGNATVLPDYADVSSVLYGIELSKLDYDYRFNPRKGYGIKLSGAAGNRQIKRNDLVNPILYDSLDLSSTQYKGACYADLFIPLARKATLMIASDNAWIVGSELFDNELFQFGGLRSFRGFDEESFRASYYSIATAELRYLYEKNAYVSLFWNGAYYEKRTVKDFIHDTPYGFGAGLSFETRIGIFSISYALGSQYGSPVLFKQSKLHFGMISYF
ncbi:MAG: BamA/TamA family outer membrane protein [Bacteroidota bacterium]